MRRRWRCVWNSSVATPEVLAEKLERDPRVAKVFYPGLETHPQYALAKRLFRHPGALFSFELNPNIDVFDFLNRLDVVIKSSNLGDNRTLAIPVAHTIYYEMGARTSGEHGHR